MRDAVLLALLLSGNVLATPRPPLRLKHEGSTVRVSQGGRTLWTRTLRPDSFPIGRIGWLKLAVPARGVLGRVAYVTYCFDGARLSCRTAGFDKHNGKPLLDAEGTPQATGSGQMITNLWTHPAGMSFTVVVGTRIDLATGRAEEVGFSIPPRPGCGSLNLSLGLSGRTTYDSRYAYAEQDDRCGVFVARFDWHGPTTQKPVILPKKVGPATP